MTVYIVTDLGFGDAGKGTTVDLLARRGYSAVVRHNGGPQAGHNVVLPDGTHHEFSQFGSGTFAGADTFLSKHMLVHPQDMVLEADHLTSVGVENVWRRMYIDAEAKVITPYHVALNRLEETARGDNRHGSCGRGVGTLMAQHIDAPELTIRVKDLTDGFSARNSLVDKLNTLRRYLNKQRPYVSVMGNLSNIDILHFDHLAQEYAEQYWAWREKVNIINYGAEWITHLTESFDHVIFEGAQGVLLDEWHGFHPHTTWSTTTHDNALSLLNEAYQGPVVRLGVTRAYMTRHGAGPFVTEDPEVMFTEPHNSYGKYQGAFRQGHLDLMMLNYAIEACGGIDGLVVTHLDRADRWKVATSYTIDYYYDAVRIDAKRGDHDLTRRATLTEMLWNKASPNYLAVDGLSQDGLLGILSRIAPVMITSHGPTHADKEVLVDDDSFALAH